MVEKEGFFYLSVFTLKIRSLFFVVQQEEIKMSVRLGEVERMRKS